MLVPRPSQAGCTAREFLIAAGWLALLLVLFQGGLVWGSQVLCGGDLVNYEYPWRAAWREGPWLAGWAPWTFGGYPFFANIQAGLLYPPNALYRVPFLPIERAATLLVLLHLLGSGLGFYLLARQRFTHGAALVSAVLWIAGGYLSLRLTNGVVIFLHGVAWLPWVLWAVETCTLERVGSIARLGLIAGMQVLAGSPQVVHITAGGALIWVIGRIVVQPGARARVRLFAAYALSGIIALAIALPQLLATRVLVSHAAGRGIAPDWGYLTADSLEPRTLLSHVFPEFYGVGASERFYWGSQSGFLEMNATLGTAGLLLALIGAVAWVMTAWRGSRDDRRWVVVLAVLSVLGLVLALGRYTPLYVLFFKFVPGFGMFRVPARWQVWIVVAGCLCAGAVWDALRAAREQADAIEQPALLKPWVIVCAALLVAIASVRLALAPILDGLGLQIVALRATPETIDIMSDTARDAVTWGLVMAVVVAGVGVATMMRRLPARAATGLLVGVVILDLLRFWVPYRQPMPTDVERWQVETESAYHRIAARDFQRWFVPDDSPTVAALRQLDPGRIVHTDDVASYLFDEYTRELYGENAAHYGLESLRGYQPLQTAQTVALFDSLLPQDHGVLLHRSAFMILPLIENREPLDAMNVTHVWSWLPALEPSFAAEWEALGLRRVNRLEFPDAMGPLEIWENPHAAGWGWVSTDPEWPGLDGRLHEIDVIPVTREPGYELYEIILPAGTGRTFHAAAHDFPGWSTRLAEDGEPVAGRSFPLPDGPMLVGVERRYEIQPPLARRLVPLSLAVMLGALVLGAGGVLRRRTGLTARRLASKTALRTD